VGVGAAHADNAIAAIAAQLMRFEIFIFFPFVYLLSRYFYQNTEKNYS
jgi:hypothetical protein